MMLLCLKIVSEQKTPVIVSFLILFDHKIQKGFT